MSLKMGIAKITRQSSPMPLLFIAPAVLSSTAPRTWTPACGAEDISISIPSNIPPSMPHRSPGECLREGGSIYGECWRLMEGVVVPHRRERGCHIVRNSSHQAGKTRAKSTRHIRPCIVYVRHSHNAHLFDTSPSEYAPLFGGSTSKEAHLFGRCTSKDARKAAD